MNVNIHIIYAVNIVMIGSLDYHSFIDEKCKVCYGVTALRSSCPVSSTAPEGLRGQTVFTC